MRMGRLEMALFEVREKNRRCLGRIEEKEEIILVAKRATLNISVWLVSW